MLRTDKRLTAAQVILLAADDIAAGGATEFTEWDLTMAAWTRDKGRFGLRGYEADHPDHKRVAMEIMGKKSHNPARLGFIIKVAPNIYRITDRGRVEAKRLRNGGPTVAATTTVPAICAMDPRWFARMSHDVADDPAARAALSELWVYLCRHPRVNRHLWEWTGREWVSTAKG